MGQVTSLFVRKVIAEVDDSVDKIALLRLVGLDPDSPIDPSQICHRLLFSSRKDRGSR